MDKNFYQDDEFEQFLQDEVKQHRMYPSDHIWKNIRTELHGYKAWPALTFISLFIITALTVSTLLINHPVVPGVYLVNTATIAKAQEPAVVSAAVPSTLAKTEKDYFQRNDPGQVTAETFARVAQDDNNIASDFIQPTLVRSTSDELVAVPVKLNRNDRSITTPKPNVSGKLTATTDIIPAETITTETKTESDRVAETPAQTAAPTQEKSSSPETTEPKKITDNHPSADEFLKDFDYVQNKPKPRGSKVGIQFYITPSTSYRRLSDEKVKEVIQPAVTAAQTGPLVASTSGDVNNAVRHKPAIGLEAGFAVLYNMSDKLKFKTGLQLNVRQYYIETFQSRTNDLTSLALINSRGVETINFYSPYNNNTGYKQTQLDNQLYQVSLPLGIQWNMIQGRHFGITSEASIQPTLTLNSSTFLLSTDYKHYTTGGDFIRKWNINTSVGVNLTYRTRNASWQIGPQVRYQHLPTYSNTYPIKEYLLDYGVRIGYTRQMW